VRKKILAGNWKMNCLRDEALSLASEIRCMISDEYTGNAQVIVAPPFVHIAGVVKLLENSGIAVAAQTCASEYSGAFTGEVSAAMVASVGAGYVIIGHSERRSYFSESNSDLAAKVNLALKCNLRVIFCAGETLSQRNAMDYMDTVKQQLEESLFHLDASQMQNVVIAYEPVWAIGTGVTASPEQAQEMHAFIRKCLTERYDGEVAGSISILYGGSCNESNAASIFALPDVDGGLIGGASLKSRSFVNILKCL
jgi:triosephosphate isomerase